MIIAKIIGTVVASQKDERLEGKSCSSSGPSISMAQRQAAMSWPWIPSAPVFTNASWWWPDRARLAQNMNAPVDAAVVV
jgi:hypothetical protein